MKVISTSHLEYIRADVSGAGARALFARAPAPPFLSSPSSPLDGGGLSTRRGRYCTRRKEEQRYVGSDYTGRVSRDIPWADILLLFFEGGSA